MVSLISRSALAGAIGEAFFPADVPSLQLLSAFAVFAVGYLMRSIGGLCRWLRPTSGAYHW